MGAEHLRRTRSHATRRCLWPGSARVRARTVGHSYRHRRRVARLYSMVEAIQRGSVLVHRRVEQFKFKLMLTYRQWRRGMDRVYLLVEPHSPCPWVVPRGRRHGIHWRSRVRDRPIGGWAINRVCWPWRWWGQGIRRPGGAWREAPFWLGGVLLAVHGWSSPWNESWGKMQSRYKRCRR